MGREGFAACSLGFYPSFLASEAWKRVEPMVGARCQVVTGHRTARGADAEVSKRLEDDAREDVGPRASDDLADGTGIDER